VKYTHRERYPGYWIGSEAKGYGPKTAIHKHLEAASTELLEFIKERMPFAQDGWVAAAEIKQSLGLNFVAVPRAGTPRGEKGWLFATLTRMLEDRELLDYKKVGSRAFHRARES
jgi:hypothetical protein